MEQQKLNPVFVYILAILGLLCCCFGGLGFILAGIAFFIAQSKLKQVAENPEGFEAGSIKAMNTAKIVALVIVVINVLYFLWSIYQISTIGWGEMTEEVMKAFEQAQNAQGQ
jgi:hypothetical protein